MSRVYFHTPSGDAEIMGSERAWLSFVAAGPATYAWDFDRAGLDCERAYQLVELSPEVDGGRGSYVHTYMRAAQAEDKRYHDAWREYAAGRCAMPSFNPEYKRRFLDGLKTRLKVDGLELHINGNRLHTSNIELNTALVAGSDVVALAAKIHGWCESHAWFAGEHRDWLAGLIEQGLDAGIFRRGIWYSDSGAPDAPKDKWASQGWEELVTFLRARDDEPVVMSYSVCDQFPNRWEAEWEAPPVPADWMPEYWKRPEWEALSEDEREEYREESGPEEQWYALSAAEQWRIAMDTLRRKKPWAQITPDNLRTTSFHKMVTVYDLFVPDRDERIARAFTEPDEEEEKVAA